MTPGMKKIGIKTATSETEIEIMVKLISRDPISAACNGVSPFSIWRTMFSSITMASSTTSPTASVIASSEILSRLYPKARIKATVANSEIGSDSAGMKVALALRRNRKITSRTSAMVAASVS